MALVPLTYNLRSLVVRRSATLLTVLGIGATVAVVAGVLALQQGFHLLFATAGREDIIVCLRPGSTNEGDSVFSRERAQTLVKSTPEFRSDANGLPLASLETYLAVRRHKVDGGETNVPVRGIQPATFAIHGDRLRIVEGRRPEPGTDEVIVGSKITARIRDCRVGDVITFNTTPFRVVGVFDSDGPYASEVWGDVDRIGDALDRPVYSRVIALLADGVDPEEFAARIEHDPHTPAKALTEREFLSRQTFMLSGILLGLGTFLGLIMGIGAIFTATNTMLAALAARTHEIGILLSVGFKPFAIFLSFLFEAAVLGLVGGVVGCLMTLPLNGIQTGTMNFQTFTEVAFAFRVTPAVLGVAVAFAFALGLAGGAWPAWRAARMSATEALRRA